VRDEGSVVRMGRLLSQSQWIQGRTRRSCSAIRMVRAAMLLWVCGQREQMGRSNCISIGYYCCNPVTVSPFRIRTIDNNAKQASFIRCLRDCFLKTFQDTDDTVYTVGHGKTFINTVLFRVVREICVFCIPKMRSART
jgi:hypothetical protein